MKIAISTFDGYIVISDTSVEIEKNSGLHFSHIAVYVFLRKVYAFYLLFYAFLSLLLYALSFDELFFC